MLTCKINTTGMVQVYSIVLHIVISVCGSKSDETIMVLLGSSQSLKSTSVIIKISRADGTFSGRRGNGRFRNGRSGSDSRLCERVRV